MKTTLATTAALVLALTAQAEFKIDRSAMSEKYWSIWNDEVQAKIDAEIEANLRTTAPMSHFPSMKERRREIIALSSQRYTERIEVVGPMLIPEANSLMGSSMETESPSTRGAKNAAVPHIVSVIPLSSLRMFFLMS